MKIYAIREVNCYRETEPCAYLASFELVKEYLSANIPAPYSVKTKIDSCHDRWENFDSLDKLTTENINRKLICHDKAGTCFKSYPFSVEEIEVITE